ncbi:hypothetical protein FEM48_Zijuj12G0182900 [Ziziphus jujuba var. spinosa]|uniref:Uncharacterized protein n=1 Tax=Ziziphus jujuba var. spinosa TaxID=714518 RepID=A0A978UET2_ZIZJJ|nr:hypothetical protein FEM48_Zijuj12G0182900 [Ziziphus jujuba var. spinosa]
MVCLGASSNWLVYNTHSEYLDRGVVKDFGVNGSEEIMLTARKSEEKQCGTSAGGLPCPLRLYDCYHQLGIWVPCPVIHA